MKKLIMILMLLPMITFGNWNDELEKIRHEAGAYNDDYTCLQFTNSFKKLNMWIHIDDNNKHTLVVVKKSITPGPYLSNLSAFTFDEILEDNVKTVVIKATKRFKKDDVLTGKEAQQALIVLCRDIIKNK